MQSLGAETVLLTELDVASKDLYPRVRTSPPSIQAVDEAFTQINQRIDKAHKEGKKTTLYVFYTGHGNVHHGEGYVELSDGR